jgi:hypothetical protein
MTDELTDLRSVAAAAIAEEPAWQEAYSAARAALLERARHGRLELAEIQQMLGELDAAVAAAPAARRREHDDWALPRKLVPGAVQPGRPLLALVLAARIRRDLIEWRYAAERFAHPGPCDCAVLVRLAITSQKPDSPSLRLVASQTIHDAEYVCDACGARWFEGTDCDDLGVRSDWTPLG